MRIFWLNREEILERLRQAVDEIVARYPEITEVLLLGSLARGNSGPGSDADLLVVLRESDLPFLDRCVRYRPGGIGVGVDVFAYTEDELEEMLAAGNAFVAQALREGVVLFRRPGARNDR